MPREKAFRTSGVTRRVTISGWEVITPIGQPLNKTSIGVRLVVQLVENGVVVDTQSAGFNVNGADAAAFMNAVETARAEFAAAGASAPVAHLKAWRKTIYALVPESVIAADAATTFE